MMIQAAVDKCRADGCHFSISIVDGRVIAEIGVNGAPSAAKVYANHVLVKSLTVCSRNHIETNLLWYKGGAYQAYVIPACSVVGIAYESSYH
jgi:hypothetical protein